MRCFASALSLRKDSTSLSIADFDLGAGFVMTNYSRGPDFLAACGIGES
jgi:hypothetical protein